MANIQPEIIKVESLASKAWTWIKGEWHNLGTFVSVAYLALKAKGVL